MGLQHHIQQLAEGSQHKLVFSVIFTVVSILEGFYGELIWGLIAFLILDFVTGIWKSLVLGTRITSKRLRESINKAGTYFLLITTLIVASRIEPTFLPFITVAYYYCIFTEMKSVLENLEELGLTAPKNILDKLESLIPINTNKKKEDDKNE